MTETMLQAILEEDELLYLLETLSAKTVWDIDNARLFPATDIVREQRLTRGLALLKEHGWLLPAAHDTWNMDVSLIRMIAAVADPEIVLTTTYFLSTTTKAVIAHYLAPPLIIELAQLENATYRLISLPSLPFLFGRLGQSLALSFTATIPTVQPMLVDSSVFRQMSAHSGSSSFNGGVPVDNNVKLRQVLTNAHLLAEIKVGRTNGDALLKQIMLILWKANDGVWVAQYTDENKPMIRLEPVTMTNFADQLATVIRALLQISPEPI